MKPPAKWVEYWLYKSTDVSKDVIELNKDRQKHNIAENVKVSRALLAYQVSKLKQFKTFLKKFPLKYTEKEMNKCYEKLNEIEKTLNMLAYREAARQGADLAIALVAGMRKLSTEDFVDLAAQSCFWHLYRLSPYAGSGDCCPLTSWASSFARIAFEATCTGPSNQKNKIVAYSLEQSGHRLDPPKLPDPGCGFLGDQGLGHGQAKIM